MKASPYSFSEQLISEISLRKALSKRQKSLLFKSVSKKECEKYQKQGWEVIKHQKTSVKISRKKTITEEFNDQLWCLFANLGFSKLNRDGEINIPRLVNSQPSIPFSVLAADDEAILIISSKVITGEPQKSNFAKEIKMIGENKVELLQILKKNFGHSNHKIKFIIATRNYFLSDNDRMLLESFSIIHFDDESYNYYLELSKHLGLAARFQLLGNLFEGQTIPQLQNQIPAIQGKMGGHTYYSFSIEPEKLLKIGYVLHRNKANKKLMPTYQRIIKKKRLVSVQEFVEDGGFFPNSIIININSPKALRFDKANTQVEDAISKIGILYLPKNYRSAFIIDGQHRLYGYINSEYKKKNSIPVVAFVNLDRNQQVKLFMQINENQKAVPKNLRNTLNADLLWDSENLIDSIKAIKLQIAQDLGEDFDSPLFDRIIIGENQKTKQRCITIDTIKLGLDRSNFFGSFSKESVKIAGTFYKETNELIYDCLMPYLKGCFNYIKTNLNNEWNLGEDKDGCLSINAGIESLIRIFSDIADHLLKSKTGHIKSIKTDILLEKVSVYLSPIISYFNTMTSEEKMVLRKSYGTAGRAKYWRILQKVVKSKHNDFNPDGFSEFLKNEEKQFNEDSFRMIRDIETYLKADFKEKLQHHYGNSWFKKGTPASVYEDANVLAAQKNREIERDEEEVEPWDCLNMIDYRKIALFASNWRDIFEKHYTKPGEEKIRGGKDDKTKWFQKLERIRNQNVHSYAVKEDEFTFLTELYNWLVAKTTQNHFELNDVDV